MTDSQYVRAVYDAERDSYVSTQTDWLDDEPSLEYRFEAVEAHDKPGFWEGGLYKLWADADAEPDGECFTFGEYASEADFEADVRAILEEARTLSVRANLDEFLAVIDIVKERAMDNGLVEDDIEDLEGLFEDGPEDAYTLNDIGDEPRLHDHVERDDECWMLHIAEVLDEENQPLGWGLFVIHFPELGCSASSAEVQNAVRAEVLLLDQLHTKIDALLAANGFRYYMETERMEGPVSRLLE